MFKQKYLVVILTMLFGITSLYGSIQAHIPGDIVIMFEDYISDDAINEFIIDFDLYELRLVARLGHWRTPIVLAYFNYEIIDENEFLEMISTDEKVRSTQFFSNWEPGYIHVLLRDIKDYYDFIRDYSLVPTVETFPEPWMMRLGIISTSIDELDLLKLIRNDSRVITAGFFPIWLPGALAIGLFDVEEIAINDFISDYGQYDLRLSSAFVAFNVIYVTFDFSLINEIEFIEIIRKDDRVMYVELEEMIYLSESDLAIPLSRLSSFVYPNPVRGNEVTFKLTSVGNTFMRSVGDTADTEISIYNIRGQLIKKSNDFQTRDGENIFVWNRTDNNNQEVASGVYFYRVKSNEQIHSGKLLILK